MVNKRLIIVSSALLILSGFGAYYYYFSDKGLSKEEAYKTALEESKAKGSKSFSPKDYISLWKKTDQKDFIIKAVEKDFVSFPKFEGRWELIEELNDPKIALKWALTEKEPLQDNILDILEKTIYLSNNEDEKLRISALLYRHNRSAGKEYLLELLNKNSNKDAALILLDNNEQEAVDGAIKYLESVEYDEKLLLKLATVKNSIVTDYLNKNLKEHLGTRSKRFDILKAIVSEKHEINSVLKNKLSRLYEHTKSDTLKIFISIAFINQQQDINSTYGKYIKDRYANFNLNKYYDQIKLFEYYSDKNFSQFENLLLSKVKEFIDSESEFRTNFHMPLFESLVSSGKEENIQLVIDSFKKKKDSYSTDDFYNSIDYEIVELIYESNHPERESVIREIMGDEFTDKLKSLKNQKKMNPEFLQYDTKYFMRRHAF